MKTVNNNDVKKIIDELMETDIKSVLKLYLSIKYEESEIDKALHSIDFIIKENKDIPVIENKPNETIQQWVQRIFRYMFNNHILSPTEIRSLHDKEYSKRTFGVNYAMLTDSRYDIEDIAGHRRYWVDPIGGYYVCSQWWLVNDREYEKKIYMWLQRVLPNYTECGLSRKHK